jgi:hypothetical protein
MRRRAGTRSFEPAAALRPHEKDDDEDNDEKAEAPAGEVAPARACLGTADSLLGGAGDPVLVDRNTLPSLTAR